MGLIYTAIVTVASGFISALVATKLGLQKDLVNTRRERLERYAVSLFAIDELLDSFKDKYLFSKDNVVNENDLNTVEMLTSLYFVNVKSELADFLKEMNAFKSFMYSSQITMLKSVQPGGSSSDVLPTQQMMTSYSPLRANVIIARNELLNSLIEKYPLLEEKSTVKNILLKIKIYFENPIGY